MLCPFTNKICDKSKILSVIENINGEQTEIQVCQDCVKKFNFMVSTPIEFKAPLSEHESDIICKCGITFMMMVKYGKLGCGECYKTFISYLKPIIERCHRSYRHTGKCPTKFKINKEIIDLEKEMKKVVSEENYEAAAKIRDIIRGLKNEMPKM